MSKAIYVRPLRLADGSWAVRSLQGYLRVDDSVRVLLGASRSARARVVRIVEETPFCTIAVVEFPQFKNIGWRTGAKHLSDICRDWDLGLDWSGGICRGFYDVD